MKIGIFDSGRLTGNYVGEPVDLFGNDRKSAEKTVKSEKAGSAGI